MPGYCTFAIDDPDRPQIGADILRRVKQTFNSVLDPKFSLLGCNHGLTGCMAQQCLFEQLPLTTRKTGALKEPCLGTARWMGWRQQIVKNLGAAHHSTAEIRLAHRQNCTRRFPVLQAGEAEFFDSIRY